MVKQHRFRATVTSARIKSSLSWNACVFNYANGFTVNTKENCYFEQFLTVSLGVKKGNIGDVADFDFFLGWHP